MVGGAPTESFERRLAEACGRQYAVTVGSGTEAMIGLLTALGIDSSWQVLIPAYSFLATATPVMHRGVMPTFVDVDDHGHFDFEKAKAALGAKRPAALIVVGLFGDSIDHDKAIAFCKENDLLLVEDAAQSFGTSFKGRPGGSLGVASTLSFAPTKPLAAFGNLGAVLTDDAELADRVRRWRYHGRARTPEQTPILGVNSVPTAATTAMLNVSLDAHPARQERCNSVAARYMEELAGLPGLELPRTREGALHNWHKFTCHYPGKRDALRAHLKDAGIETLVHYWEILPENPLFAPHVHEKFPKASELSSISLSLPLHAYLQPDEVDRIVTTIRVFCVSK